MIYRRRSHHCGNVVPTALLFWDVLCAPDTQDASVRARAIERHSVRFSPLAKQQTENQKCYEDCTVHVLLREGNEKTNYLKMLDHFRKACYSRKDKSTLKISQRKRSAELA